jgi:arsenite-transporting ATPase
MAAGKDRKYFMVGGKGGVGKTSLSSSLAVKFASSGHPTLLVGLLQVHSLPGVVTRLVTWTPSYRLSNRVWRLQNK